MQKTASARVQRANYRAPAYLLDRIALEFDLELDVTEVQATLQMRRNPSAARAPVELNGAQLELLSIELDGRMLQASDYMLESEALRLPAPATDHFTVRIRSRIRPRGNSSLMGMYVSNNSLFTQCEAEGMRRITWIPDRPDVLARYTVTLRAPRDRFPVLLSNGNLIEHGELGGGRHFAVWDDPHPKPSYLFAVVAARLASRDEKIRTRSGREALLQIWADPADLPRLEHAAASLRRAISWDETRFGRELDLDRYMIVATADFNMGAMENKGLNIFNAKYVLADPRIATDTDFATIESIIGHEYFHNWSGNRVTCRDWFQLSLKEGLTVFRDQEFTRDLLAQEARAAGADPETARAIARIDDVRALRAVQFPEDAGPMAHPVRPDAYLEISNFYTATVYEKGAEVVRMLQTLLGAETFRRGLDRYFERYDGQAVTCDDFLAAMADVSERDLSQFLRWYSQAGTPHIAVNRVYDADSGTLELRIAQSCPPTPGQPTKEPLLIPLAFGLVGPDGRDQPLHIEGRPRSVETTQVIELTESAQILRLLGVAPGSVASLFRDFSAPVIIEHHYEEAELALLAAHDSDGFNRWEAGQRIALAALLRATDCIEAGETLQFSEPLLRVAQKTLCDEAASPAFRERSLQLPSETVIAEQRAVVEPQAIRDARLGLRRWLGKQLSEQWHGTYREMASQEKYSPDSAHAGRRALRNLALSQLVSTGDEAALELARRQLAQADNLTDQYAALAAIVHSPAKIKADMLIQVAREWQGEPLLMNKWFSLQATAPAHDGEPPVLERVKVLLRHSAYSEKNPNNVNALVLGFCSGNPAEFHRPDGSGYAFWIDQVLRLDRINPIVAARVARTLERWRRFTPERSAQMRRVLEEVGRNREISRDVREIVDRALAN
ncbi:MAG TPA: aminopeptidase N [Burkholderiaceae bacterium]|nr:aminopeptidase N [Burkholderiaceae bacterium]